MKNMTELKSRLNELHEKIESGDTSQKTSVEVSVITSIIDLPKIELEYAGLRSKGNIKKIDFLET